MFFSKQGVSLKLQKGMQYLQKDLQFGFSDDGIQILAKQGDEFNVDFNGEKLNVVYKYEVEAYRAIAMTVARKTPFKHRGNRLFEEFGIHTTTTWSVPNFEGIKRFLRFFACMGYSRFYMYMQSNFEVEGEPYFGYAQGRYTQAELKEIAEYGEILGVEVVPCLELLAHQQELKRWAYYKPMYDWDDVWNVGRERTKTLIDKIIATCAKCFKSKTIHFGLDEAYLLGHGQYYRDKGKVLEDRTEIFLNHLQFLVDTAKKYGYEKYEMWSDMLYADFNNYNHYGFNQLPQEVIDRIPNDVALCYWNYYNKPDEVYIKNLEMHKATGKKVIFCAGAWTWEGLLGHNRWTMDVFNRKTFMAAKACDIKNLMITTWCRTSAMYVLPSYCYASGYAYGESEEEMKALFKAMTGCSFDDYMLLDSPNYITHDQCYVNTDATCALYNDYFIGLYDSEVVEDVSDIWLEHEAGLKQAKKRSNKEYESLFNRSIALCRIAYLKYELGLRTRRAYQANDKVLLQELIENNYKPLLKEYANYLKARRAEWLFLYKSAGVEKEDAEIGAMIQRTKSCIKILQEYVAGKVAVIEELEWQTLDIKGNGVEFDHNPDTRGRGRNFKEIFMS